MARPLCVEYPCAYYHVIDLGKNQEKIFKNKAREVAIFIARDMTGINCKDLGEYFGGVSGALITMMHNRIADESKKNKRLKGRIENIRNQIFKI
jgi:chromosomal replication initiation ATPase DnaA